MILNPNQLDMLFGLELYKVWTHVTCRRAGKTTGALNIAIIKASKPNTKIDIIGSNRQLSTYMYAILKGLLHKTNLVYRYQDSNLVIRFVNGSIIRVREPLQDKTFVPFIFAYPDLAIYEEAVVDIKDDPFNTYVNDPNIKILITGTPTSNTSYLMLGINRGKDSFYPQWGTKTYGWREVSYWKNNSKHLNLIKKSLSKKQFKREFDCK